MFALPYSINNYVMDKVIGKGGFGEVYHATSRKYPGFEFAVKCTRYTPEHTAIMEDSFKSEVSALMKLDHPNVVRLYDFFKQDDCLFLVLEYCPGKSLLERIRDQEVMTESRQLAIAGQIVSALAYCHRKRLAHRDIKEGNILFDAHGRVKVADFGLSKEFLPGDRFNQFNGSYLYAAPELFNKMEHDPFAADVWSLGVLFYRIANRQHPWPTDSKANAKKAIQYGSYREQNMKHPLMHLVKQMIIVNPDARVSMELLSDMKIWNAQIDTSMPGGRVKHLGNSKSTDVVVTSFLRRGSAGTRSTNAMSILAKHTRLPSMRRGSEVLTFLDKCCD